MTYIRPSIPYNNVSLPFDNRYINLSNNNRPATAEMIEGDFNYLIDTCNGLFQLIQAIVAGNIPGSEDILNAGKLVTTDGNSNLSWIFIDTDQLSDQSVTQDKLDLQSVGTPQLQDGGIINSKLGQQCVNTGNYALGSVGTNQIADLAITNPKLADNSIFERNYAPSSISTAAYQNLSVTTPIMNDASVTTIKIADGNVTLAKLALEVLAFLIPTGSVIPYGGDVAPSAAWILANGSILNRVTYAALFAVYGTKFGIGDGDTTFGIPDLRGRMPAGSINNNTNGLITVSSVNTTNIGGVGGFEQITLTITQIPSHTHSYVTPSVANVGAPGGNQVFANIINSTTGATGGGLPHNNMPP